MQCYFQRDGHLAGVEILPLGLSDEDAIMRAHTLVSKRKRPLDGFEVWDRARFIIKHPDLTAKPESD
jgi:D-serine deaminase-like pyridoxal phosphate-dependent protein